MKIDVDVLVAVGVSPALAERWAPPLSLAADRWVIDSKLRCAAFVAQCAHESTMFSRTTEGFVYKDATRLRSIFKSVFKTVDDAVPYVNRPIDLANHVYANRYGNGPESSGDGHRYRGRGPIQITFKSTYILIGEKCGRPFGTNPDLVALPEDGCNASAAYWDWKQINEQADAGDFAGVTRKINPAMLEHDKRAALYALALQHYGVQP